MTASPGALVLPLEGRLPVEEVGHKAANLARLATLGFSVPPGFVVTTTAYRQFLAAGALEERIDAARREAGPADGASLERAAECIRSWMLDGLVSDQLAAAIAAAYEALARSAGGDGDLAVAVRSSATAEDLANASFAGQQDTMLNVRGRDAVLEAVRHCWASLWTARAMQYRRHHAPGALDTSALAQAVLVQRLVPADVAGVLFTLDPVSGATTDVLINASWGIGDGVVAGRVSPDVLTVSKATGEIVRCRRGAKATMTSLLPQGTAEVPVTAERRDGVALSRDQASRLAGVGCAIEAQLGAPQDVEWAIADDTIWLLQARPVTAAGGASTSGRVPGDDSWPTLEERPPATFDRWTRANVGELWPNPVSPLVASTLPWIIGEAVRYALDGIDTRRTAGIQWARRYYGRVYYNEGALKHVLSHELGLPASLLDRGRGHRSADEGRDGRIDVLALLRRLPPLSRVLWRHRHSQREIETLLSSVAGLSAEFAARAHFEQSDAALWQEARLWLERMVLGMKLQNQMSGTSLTSFAALEALVSRWCGRDDLAPDLITGLSEIEAAEIGPAIGELAGALQAAGLASLVQEHEPERALELLRRHVDAGPALVALDSFLAQHGHRCPNDSEWLHPRWGDRPALVLELAAAYLRSDSSLDAATRSRAQRRRREETTARIEASLDPLRRAVFRALLARVQTAVRLRDNGKSAAMKLAHPARRIAQLFGERWAERGWLTCAEDVFFLTVPDIERVVAAGHPAAAGLDLVPLVAARRAAYAYWRGVEGPDAIDADGRPILPPVRPGAAPHGAPLVGIAASSGRVRGKARVVSDPHAAVAIEAGDILVTRATDAGWSAVFPLIGALVTEMGGQLSHAAIVAREYGVPAVVNVADAGRLIRDGDIIVVDGGAGTVHVEQASGAGERVAAG